MQQQQRRQPIMVHRPRTSAADEPKPKRFDTGGAIKRTASQYFVHSHPHDVMDTGLQLQSVQEGARIADCFQGEIPRHHSLSQVVTGVAGGVKQICRRLSTSSSSSRRPSFSDAASIRTRKSSYDVSNFDTHQPAMTPTSHQSKWSSLRRIGSFRQRRPATSGPSGEAARFNPIPAPVPANYPMQAPGSAARAAAAAANNAMREQEQTARFIAHGSSERMEGVLKDNESGVGMSCISPVSTTSTFEKRFDPIEHLPVELCYNMLSYLDAESLAACERLNSSWHDVARSAHVWRNVYLRKFEQEVHVSPAPIIMGGAGIGKFRNDKPVPGQDWKRMYRVRKTVDRRWKAATPSAIYLNGHTDSVYCCQFDENKLITGSRDRTIRVWDMKTYRCVKVLGGPGSSPAAGTPNTLETHKETVVNEPSMNGTPDGQAIFHVPSDYHLASILCLQFDDRIMVTGSSDHTCIVWDITGEEYIPIFRLRRHSAGVLDVCLDEKHIISCSKDATINIWDRQTGRHIRELVGHRGPVNAVQLRGNLLVSASGDGVAKLWNLDSGMCIKEFPSQDRGLAAVEFSDDGKYVLAGGNDHVVYKFDALTGALMHTSPRHGGLVRSLFLDTHNGRVISGSYDQSIRVCDFATGQVYGQFENWTTSWILSAKCDYRRVVATSQDGRAIVLDFGWGVEGAELLTGRLE